MTRIYPRIGCLLILALASSACGSGTPTNGSTATATLTKFVLPPEATPVSPDSATLNPAAPSDPTLSPTIAAPGDSALTPTIGTPANPAVTPTTGAFTTPISPGLPNGPLCNDAIFVDDVTIPDGTILKPEEEFEKTWKFKNTGICKWTTSYAIGFSHGNRMGGTETKLPLSVDPGYTVDVTIKMTAPKDNGWYGGWWRLKSEIGNYFGDFVFVSILVSDGSETSTPNP